MFSSVLSDNGLSSFQWAAVLGGSLAAAATDWHHRRIPNWLTGLMLLGGLLHAGYVAGWLGLADALGACVLLALPYIVLFVLADGGAGDAKLMGAIGAWLGWAMGLVVLLAVAVCGIVLGLLIAGARRRRAAVFAHIIGSLRVMWLTGGGAMRPKDAARFMPQPSSSLSMPYAVAIFLGTCGAGVIWHWL